MTGASVVASRSTVISDYCRCNLAFSMTISRRDYHWKEDFDLVRRFLMDTYNLTHTFQNWIPSMFENIKYGPCGSEYNDEVEDRLIGIWEETSSSSRPSSLRTIAVTNSSTHGDSWIHIHPSYRHTEREIVRWLEEQRMKSRSAENPKLELYFRVSVTDEERRTLLKELGYEDAGLEECIQVRPVNAPIPKCRLPKGFEIRQADLGRDFERYRAVQAAVFPHCARMTERLARVYASAQFYNADLDLVVVAPSGEFASFVMVRIDPVSRMAELEPVGTHPDYRRLGLARAVICEGFRRARKYRPVSMCIIGAAATEAASRLYASVGFTQKTDVHLWKKIF